MKENIFEAFLVFFLFLNRTYSEKDAVDIHFLPSPILYSLQNALKTTIIIAIRMIRIVKCSKFVYKKFIGKALRTLSYIL